MEKSSAGHNTFASASLMADFYLDSSARNHAFRVENYCMLLLSLPNIGKCFSPQDETLLLEATLLHDVGHCVSAARHDTHSELLIARELVGENYSHKRINELAGLAGSHRKKLSSRLSKHQECTKLAKLASVLRFADGLDYIAFFNGFILSRIYLEKNQLHLAFKRCSDDSYDSALKRLDEKAALFQKAFQLSVKYNLVD